MGCMPGRPRGSCRRRPPFDAVVQVQRPHQRAAGPADAKSLNAVATLGAATGHEFEVTATGPGAADAIASLCRRSRQRNFDEDGRRPR